MERKVAAEVWRWSGASTSSIYCSTSRTTLTSQLLSSNDLYHCTPASATSYMLLSTTTAAYLQPSVTGTHLICLPFLPKQRCRPPHLYGGLLYLSRDYPPLPPSAPPRLYT